jgi:hypothetical protein
VRASPGQASFQWVRPNCAPGPVAAKIAAKRRANLVAAHIVLAGKYPELMKDWARLVISREEDNAGERTAA